MHLGEPVSLPSKKIRVHAAVAPCTGRFWCHLVDRDLECDGSCKVVTRWWLKEGKLANWQVLSLLLATTNPT